MRGASKKAQQSIGMSFEMIFSIFLIIIFFIIAFIAISYFLDIGKTADVGIFYDDLQKAVEEARSGQSSESTFQINLPSEITKVCFANLSASNVVYTQETKPIELYDIRKANVFLIPPQAAQNMEYKWIEGVNITKITKTQNPYCVEADAKLTLKKDFFERLVSIS
jgi:hypothetical protein